MNGSEVGVADNSWLGLLDPEPPPRILFNPRFHVDLKIIHTESFFAFLAKMASNRPEIQKKI
jgi:hypothetical protein